MLDWIISKFTAYSLQICLLFDDYYSADLFKLYAVIKEKKCLSKIIQIIF